MHVCMYEYMSIFLVSMNVCAYMHVCTPVPTHVHACVCVYVCVSICVCVCDMQNIRCLLFPLFLRDRILTEPRI